MKDEHTMTTPELFNVVPWRADVEGDWVHCYADSDANPQWKAAPVVAPVTDIDCLEDGDDFHVLVRVGLTPDEVLILDFGAILSVPYEAYDRRFRLWVNGQGGIEVTGMAPHLERLQEHLRSALGLAAH
jgi:hypothetical protein